MKCDCGAPLALRGVSTSDDKLKMSFSCSKGHRIIKDGIADYRDWVANMAKRRDDLERLLTGTIPVRQHRGAVSGMIGEIMAEAVSIVIPKGG